MEQYISTKPIILRSTAGHMSCSIYKVPPCLMDINRRQSYEPQVVSIGPYHHGLHKLKMIEEHKCRYLSLLLKRIEAIKVTYGDLLQKVHPLAIMTRDCYSETIPFGDDELTKILVLDGSFIIELFRRWEGLVPFVPADPLGTMSWIYTSFVMDLIRLENQIPFFILQCLFDITQMPGEKESGPSLAYLTMKFFNCALKRPMHVIDRNSTDLNGKHILDILRFSFMPLEYRVVHHAIPDQRTHVIQCDSKLPQAGGHVIQCVSKLRRAGISLKLKQEDTFLIIKFRRGVIEMPKIEIDDFMCSFLLNCVAYEQCHNEQFTHMTTYATLLDCLINTSKDVEYLCEQNIIENQLGSDGKAAKFINLLGNGVTLNISNCYLESFFQQVNEHYNNQWHVQLASFKYTYFRTPWSFISAMAAFLLLVLTALQTAYTILGSIDKGSSS